ncbi:MFS transporter [Pseudonocardia bannensis]|uniref:MFS transporter n=1 Tax=Pseudonocardia bannensis TaxID=630973 RepID=UPI0028AEB740|nr:MFS transporter [Pseudonocardia bannensis]
MTEVSAEVRPEKLGFGRLLRTSGFRRLLAVRLTAQWGDGMFQAALGGAVLFNPERQADPLAVAAGLAVMLLPYSVIGPFAGALLDRWDRRRVLMVANLLRAVLVLMVAIMVGGGAAGLPLYLGALAVAGVSRFVLSGLSASLPHVVERRHLVEANVVAATAGAAVAALGGASAIGLRAVLGAGDMGSALTTAAAVVGSVLAAVIAARFRRRLLGPDETNEPRQALLAVARGLADGARATASTPTVAGSFLALAAHRLAFGVTTLVSLMLFRYAFTDSGVLRAGMAGVGEAVVLAALGLGAAALLTPWLAHRIGRARTVRVALLVAAAAQLGLAVTLTLPAVLVAAFVLAAAGQVVKLCADAGVQSEAGDAVRGRVFALYDAVFNVCYVLAVGAAAVLSPPDGRAPLLMVGAAAVYALGLLAHDWQLRRVRTRTC